MKASQPEAVKRSGKKLQVGTQSRSTACVRAGIERVLMGEIGEILVAKAWNSQRRGNIGKTQPSAPPPHLDFNTWLAPAVQSALVLGAAPHPHKFPRSTP